MSESTPTGTRLWLLRLALLLPVLLLLLLLELGARFHAWYSDSTLQRGLEQVGGGPEADDLSLQHIIRWHENPRIIYELIPGLSGTFRGHPLIVNSAGFRGPEIPVEKPEDVIRIVGVGDSVMFGWGVAGDESYLVRLCEKLEAAYPDRRFECLNAAVPGYNTVNEVETLKGKLIGYQPDLVIVGWVSNDLHPPGFLRTSQPYFTIRKSFFAEWIRNRIDGLHVPDSELERPPDAFRRESFLGEEERIPVAYREVMGLEAFRGAVIELAELADQHGFEVLVFAHYGFDKRILEVLSEAKLRTLDGYPFIRGWMQDHDVNEFTGSLLTVSSRDPHPSALFHDLLAELLATELSRHQLID